MRHLGLSPEQVALLSDGVVLPSLDRPLVLPACPSDALSASQGSATTAVAMAPVTAGADSDLGVATAAAVEAVRDRLGWPSRAQRVKSALVWRFVEIPPGQEGLEV